MKLSTIVPWGRNLDEYVRMFGLEAKDLEGTILGCGDGPASANAELTRQGRHIVSLDPIYAYSAEQIRDRINDTSSIVLDHVKSTQDKYVWSYFSSPQDLYDRRMESMDIFLSDFTEGKDEGRYLAGELPELPFEDSKFSLVLVSHLLFLYDEMLSLWFHVKSIEEMLRVGREVRIFPLANLNGERSAFLEPVLEHFKKEEHLVVEMKPVSYEFQKGVATALCIRRK